jgi:hypothetical protein
LALVLDKFLQTLITGAALENKINHRSTQSLASRKNIAQGFREVQRKVGFWQHHRANCRGNATT